MNNRSIRIEWFKILLLLCVHACWIFFIEIRFIGISGVSISGFSISGFSISGVNISGVNIAKYILEQPSHVRFEGIAFIFAVKQFKISDGLTFLRLMLLPKLIFPSPTFHQLRGLFFVLVRNRYLSIHFKVLLKFFGLRIRIFAFLIIAVNISLVQPNRGFASKIA